MNDKTAEDQKRLPIGCAPHTNHIVGILEELGRMIDDFRNTTRESSHWQGLSGSSLKRVREAEAIIAMAKALGASVKARAQR